MQDRYVGDIGDFGKYGLLRELARPKRSQVTDQRPLKLGVVWCRSLPETNTDGMHVRYLEPTPGNLRRFRTCDPELYDALGRVVAEHDRNVARVERERMLPVHTVYFSDVLTYKVEPAVEGRNARQALGLSRRRDVRDAWVRRAFERVAGCDFVFFDPDNGLPTSAGRHSMQGPKFVFYDEIEPFIRRGQTLIVYQHGNRRGTTREQLQRRFGELAACFGPRPYLACVFRRCGVRSLIVVPVGPSGELVCERARAFASLPGWREHFSLIE